MNYNPVIHTIENYLYFEFSLKTINMSMSICLTIAYPFEWPIIRLSGRISNHVSME